MSIKTRMHNLEVSYVLDVDQLSYSHGFWNMLSGFTHHFFFLFAGKRMTQEVGGF